MAPEDASSAAVEQSKKVGWYTFCMAKCLLLGANVKVLDTYHLLVCVLELLLTHLPLAARQGSLWSSLGEVTRESYPMAPAARAALHAELKVQPGEVVKLTPEMGKLVAELRATLGLQPGAAEQSGGVAGFLRSSASQPATLDKLEARYPALAAQTGEPFDGRYMLTAPMPAPAPLGAGGASTSGVMSSPHRASSSSVSKQSSALLTPLRGKNPLAGHGTPAVVHTPMSGQLECVGWLRSEVAGISADGPSAALAAYFDQCETSPTARIQGRLERLCGLLSARLEASELDSEVEERCAAGRRLYYKMLLGFLAAEERRLQQTAFLGTLLANDTFHVSLFACCMEAVLAAYSMTSLAFPAVAETLELQAFDFYKVIESFVQQVPDLPKYLRDHFREVEVKVLEKLAWADDSPLHALTKEYDQLQSSPEGAAPKRAKAALGAFLKKVEYLAAYRVHDMCTRLLLRTPLVVQVWECLKAVIHTPARQLLVGRHLDQIIMCTIYGVCKVNKRTEEDAKTFRHIIEQYKRQEKASAKVFREVRMQSAADQPQDIIAFYNKIFIPHMKDNLLRILREVTEERAHLGSGSVTASPRPGGAVARGLASPQRVISSRDVFVSHPRTPSASMTPRTRTLYAFGDSPAGNLGRVDNLQHVNHSLSCAPSDGNVAANALRALSTTPSRAGTPSAPSPGPASSSAGLMPAPPPEPPSRKRSAEGGGMSRKQLQRRLNDDVPLAERSLSAGSNGSSSPDVGAQPQ